MFWRCNGACFLFCRSSVHNCLCSLCMPAVRMHLTVTVCSGRCKSCRKLKGFEHASSTDRTPAHNTLKLITLAPAFRVTFLTRRNIAVVFALEPDSLTSKPQRDRVKQNRLLSKFMTYKIQSSKRMLITRVCKYYVM